MPARIGKPGPALLRVLLQRIRMRCHHASAAAMSGHGLGDMVELHRANLATPDENTRGRDSRYSAQVDQ